MIEWNPVKGMKELKWDELQVGDDVVQQSSVNPSNFVRIFHVSPYELSRNSKYFLLHREVKEPIGRGDLVEVYRVNPMEHEDEVVETYIRVRPQHLDDSMGDKEAWTDSQNMVNYDWSDVLAEASNVSGRAVRTFVATHKQV